MRATILALGLAVGLFGFAGEASAQFGYGYPGYYGAYNPGVYGVGRGPFVGGRYLAAPTYGYGYGGGYPAVGGYNSFNSFNFGYSSGFGGGYPAVGGFGYPGYGYGGYRSGFSLGFYRGF